MTATIHEFLDVWAHAERAGDAATLATMLTDDFVGVGPLGFALTKPAWLGRFSGGLAYEQFELADVQTRTHGDAAIITGRQTNRGTHRGGPLPYEVVRTTLVAVRDAEDWRLAAVHMSFIAGTPGAPAMPAAAGGPRG